MNRRILLSGVLALAAMLFAISPAAALAAPEYDVKATWSDTNLPPGGVGVFDVWVRNIGDASSEEALFVNDELPAGVSATGIHFKNGFGQAIPDDGELYCSGVGTGTVECVFPGSVLPELVQAPGPEAGDVANPTGYMVPVEIEVAIDPGAAGEGINTATVSGGGAGQADTDVDVVPFGTIPAPFGIVPGSYESDFFDAAFPLGQPDRQAGAHPFELRVNFDLNLKTGHKLESTQLKSFPSGSLSAAEATLPRGMISNPEATPKCDPVKFTEKGATKNSTACPANTQVGYLNVATAGNLTLHQALTRVPVYNLEPPKGQVADFGFNGGGYVQGHIFGSLDPGQNYAIKALTPNISTLVPVTGSEVVFWGVPGDPAHDKFRYYPKVQPGNVAVGASFGATSIRPLFTNPSDCGFDNGGTRLRLESYNQPGIFTPVEESPHHHNVNGCDDPRFRFDPDISLQPTSRAAGAPTGLDVHLQVPQRNDEVEDAKKLYAENHDVQGISTPPVKKVVVTLPEGMTLSPSAAQGLQGCSSTEIGLGTDRPVRCPDASQYGTLVLHTPLLPANAQPEGWIYVAKQSDNPFHNFLSIYLVIQEPDRGILVKIPGRLDLDPNTGQITTTFEELPQFPVSDMQMTFKGGVRAGLVEPSTCGRKTIRAEFFSWQDPATPHVVNSSYEVTQKQDGTPCVNSLGERPFRPQLEAGTVENTAGAYSPLVFRLTRSDDDQELSQLSMTLPQGLLAKIAGVAMCPDASIAKAISRTDAGEGALEQLEPSCSASSLIGTTDVGVGVGVPLTYVPGKIYLAGPYHGAPLSVVAITPAVVGPYDLGVIAIRSALRVDPETAQASAITDPFPQIYQGIPVRIRDLRIDLDRPQFSLNPTSCAAKQITASVAGAGGDIFSTLDDSAAELANRFQAADCASLGFRPKFALRLLGGTRRGGHPRLRVTLKMPAGGANIATTSVTLPHSEFLDQGHIKTVCTRIQFKARQCPEGSVYGHAVARTPLFDQPLEGPVYLRSSTHQLPDLVFALRGPASQPVEVDLSGRIDSVNGGIRTTFNQVPDAPVQSFTLSMRGGAKGLIVNSVNLCAKANKATIKLRAQNGRKVKLHPAVKATCGKGARERGRDQP
jgi:hypothetical protein